MKIGIATAKVDLSQKMKRYKHLSSWYWNILFSDTTSTSFDNLLIQLSSNRKKAKEQKKLIKEVFKDFGLKSGSQVLVLFSRDNHNVLAIGYSGKKLWIDVDDYKPKEINELDIDITSLKVNIDY